MKLLRFLLIIVTISCVSKANGQINFENDVKFKYKADSSLLAIGIKHPDFKKVDFELRYWITSNGFNYARELFILDYRDKKWYLNHYKVCFNYTQNSHSIIYHTYSELYNWSATFTKLKQYNIFNLPDQNIAGKNWMRSDSSVFVVSDGIGFAFELITKSRKRSYAYSNPKDYLNFYGSKYTELVNVNKIIETLNKEFHFKGSEMYECPKEN